MHHRAARSAGTAAERTARLAAAEGSLRQAVAETRALWSGLGEAEGFKISTQDADSVTHELLQRVLVEQGKAGEALEVAEQAPARALFEVLARRPWAARTVALATATHQQAFTLDDIRSFARESDATLVMYSLLYDPSGFLLTGRLGGGQREVEEALLIWVVKPSGEVALEEVDLARLRRRPRATSLAELVEESRRALGAGMRGTQPEAPRSSGRPPEEVLDDLAELLLLPIARHLPPGEEDRRLVVVPQGPLFLVPFAALPDPRGEPLVASWTLTTAPAVGALSALPGNLWAGGWAPGEVLVVGDPALPAAFADLQQLDGARREAAAVAARLGVPPLIGQAATKGAVVQAMAGKALLHLACHGLLELPQAAPVGESTAGDGLLRDGRDLPGALVLASRDGDGLLTAGEVSDLVLGAELVVLSACDTGGGRITGDGVVGLARSFLTAGAGAVLVSLWQVDDASTTFLMRRFYHHLGEAGSAAAALRQAMLDTRRKHPDPRLWAGFVLIGRPGG